jgi:hypothetical protein
MPISRVKSWLTRKPECGASSSGPDVGHRWTSSRCSYGKQSTFFPPHHLRLWSIIRFATDRPSEVTRDYPSRLLHFLGGPINRRLAWRVCDAVDDFGDAKSREFHKAQQLSTSWPHLGETKCTENRGFFRNRNDRLGLSGPPFVRIFRFNNLENLVCGTLRNSHLQFRLQFVGGEFLDVRKSLERKQG